MKVLLLKQLVWKAKRHGQFWLLPKIEQGIMSLTCRCLTVVKHPGHLKIVDNLKMLLHGGFMRRIQRIVPAIRERVAMWRVGPSSWQQDTGFIVFLAIMEANQT